MKHFDDRLVYCTQIGFEVPYYRWTAKQTAGRSPQLEVPCVHRR